MTKTPALDDLARFLRTYHPSYTIHDLAPSGTRGYLLCVKTCPKAGLNWMCSRTPHWHTISVGWYPHGYGRGHGRGAYAWWRALCAEYESLGVAVHANPNCTVQPLPVAA